MPLLFQCSCCENSFRSDEERKEHEEICVKNGKTEQKRFEARKQLAERGKISSFSQPLFDELAKMKGFNGMKFFASEPSAKPRLKVAGRNGCPFSRF